MKKIYKDYSLNENKIRKFFDSRYPGRDFYFFKETTSTFDEASLLPVRDKTVICAAKQTNGRGRLGRSWQSDEGGIYFSLILMPDMPTDKLQIITSLCAVAIQRAISKYIPCLIKWPNDIISKDGKKLCGILTKNHILNGKVTVNAGIGINANTGCFDKELVYASSIYSITKEFTDENELFCSCLEELEYCTDMKNSSRVMNEYREKSATLGKRVRLLYASDERSETGVCTGIEDDGSLTVKKDDGSIINVTSGEVSVRGIYGEQYA